MNGEVVGILASEETIKQFGTKETVMFSLGEKSDVISASRRLFKGLRFFEETKATIILAEPFNRSGIGEAYMNRLEKAAAYSVI